jgi:hypothetical protein
MIVKRSGMKMNKKYAIINSDLKIITLCNKSSYSPLRDIIFDKYTISSDNKIIEGETKEYIFDMYCDSDINEIDSSEIFEKRTLLGFGKTKRTFKSGWVLLKNRKQTKIVNPSGFIIYEEED